MSSFVRYYNWENEGKDKVYQGIAEFLGFGIDFIELDNGPINFTTAIIELVDGSVKNIYVELIEFINIKGEIQYD